MRAFIDENYPAGIAANMHQTPLEPLEALGVRRARNEAAVMALSEAMARPEADSAEESHERATIVFSDELAAARQQWLTANARERAAAERRSASRPDLRR